MPHQESQPDVETLGQSVQLSRSTPSQDQLTQMLFWIRQCCIPGISTPLGWSQTRVRQTQICQGHQAPCYRQQSQTVLGIMQFLPDTRIEFYTNHQETDQVDYEGLREEGW